MKCKAKKKGTHTPLLTYQQIMQIMWSLASLETRQITTKHDILHHVII